MTRTPQRRRTLRVAAACCLGAGLVTWFLTAPAEALTPAKTAWYDNSGAQGVTGETTPSAAMSGELEVSYAPAAATVPTQTVPSVPPIPGAPVAPPSGVVGGNTVGNTLAFAAVEYDVPLQAGGQSIDPASVAATLTLSFDQASSSKNIGTGDLIACPTATTLWSAGPDQDSTQAPQYSCSSAVTGNVDATASTVSFALTQAQENQLELNQGTAAFSLVILPGTAPSGAFQAIFTPPGDTSFSVTNEAAATNLNDNLAPTPAAEDVTPAVVDNTNPSAFALGSPAAPLGNTTTPSTVDNFQGAGTGSIGTTTGRVPVPSGWGSNAQRTIALVVLLALAALLVTASSRPVRAPHSLRVLATDAPTA